MNQTDNVNGFDGRCHPSRDNHAANPCNAAAAVRKPALNGGTKATKGTMRGYERMEYGSQWISSRPMSRTSSRSLADIRAKHTERADKQGDIGTITLAMSLSPSQTGGLRQRRPLFHFRMDDWANRRALAYLISNYHVVKDVAVLVLVY